LAVLVVVQLSGPPRADAQESDPLLGLGAASLVDVLPRLAEAWVADGGRAIRFSFDATSRLAPQALEAGHADVFFSADREWILWLEERGAIEPGQARIVAGNQLVLVVPSDEPAPSSLAELASLGLLALAGENVPAGRYAQAALEAASVWEGVVESVVRGGSVRGALEWVARGEVGAGVVYRTDAIAEPDVRIAFAFAPELSPGVEYWAAPLVTSRDPAATAAFLEYLSGPAAAAVLRASGFLPPASVTPAVQVAPAAALPSVWSAVRLSLLVALFATAMGLVPAIALGWVLARRDFRGKTLLSTVVLIPLVIPPVVTGFLLLSVLGTQSPVGRSRSAFGVSVPFTLLGATIAALVVGLPLYVISIRGAFEAVDPLYEELSWTLGEPPRRTFVRVSLPLALPGIVAGAVLAFARALGEFGATVVLAGNLEGSTRTIALAVYTLLESPAGRETTWILVGASVALSLVALLGFETLLRRQRRLMDDQNAR
jgi:molybdate transport system permease protein